MPRPTPAFDDALAVYAARFADAVGAPASASRVETLRQATAWYAEERRAAGDPVEAVFAALKRAIADPPAGRAERDAARRLVAEVLRWCLDVYFAPRGAGPPAPRPGASRAEAVA